MMKENDMIYAGNVSSRPPWIDKYVGIIITKQATSDK